MILKIGHKIPSAYIYDGEDDVLAIPCPIAHVTEPDPSEMPETSSASTPVLDTHPETTFVTS
jgi:hypothetical protein